MFSDGEDVTLGNPFGPFARGRRKAEETLVGTALQYRDGEVTGVELIAKYASDELACIIEVKRRRAKIPREPLRQYRIRTVKPETWSRGGVPFDARSAFSRWLGVIFPTSSTDPLH